MKLMLSSQSIGLSLLLLASFVAPLKAQNTSDMPLHQCEAIFSADFDEFDGIDLTAQQEQALDELEDAFEAKFKQILTPQQRLILDSEEQRLDAALATVLTPEQQAQLEDDSLDESSLSAEQEAQLLALEDEILTESAFILTAAQEDQLEAYDKAYEKRLGNILTSQQQTQFERNQFHLEFPEFTDLQLTEAQYPQVMQLAKQFRQQELEIMPEITPEQVTQLEQLEQEYEAALFQILTPQQQPIWQQDDGELNLTAEQEAQLETLDQDFDVRFQAVLPEMDEAQMEMLDQLDQRYGEQFNGVLTAQQQQQLEANLDDLDQLEDSCF